MKYDYYIKDNIALVKYERTVSYIRASGKKVWIYIIEREINYKNDNLISAIQEIESVMAKKNGQVSIRLLDIKIKYENIIKCGYDITRQKCNNEYYLRLNHNDSLSAALKIL